MSSAAENAGSGRHPARSGRSGTAAAQLLQVAGPDLYRRNPFRITGLATDTSGREVRESKKRVSTALAVGATVPGDSRLPLPQPATPDQIHAAFDVLGDPQRRLVSELFWFWGSPVGPAAAAASCTTLTTAPYARTPERSTSNSPAGS